MGFLFFEGWDFPRKSHVCFLKLVLKILNHFLNRNRDGYKSNEIRLLQGEFICEKVDEECAKRDCSELHFCEGGECKCRYNFKVEGEICAEKDTVSVAVVSKGIFYELEFGSMEELAKFDLEDESIRYDLTLGIWK